MKRLIVILPLLTAGCVTADNYNPRLASPAKSESKYQADLADCREYAKTIDCRGNHVAGSAFGLLGSAVYAAGSKAGDPCNMNHVELVDSCLVKKGYKVSN